MLIFFPFKRTVMIESIELFLSVFFLNSVDAYPLYQNYVPSILDFWLFMVNV